MIEDSDFLPGSGSSESIRPPRYHQVYAALRGWVLGGTYPPGARLPSEGELCESFGVSKITTRKAIDLLVQEKLLVRVQGKGTFVVDDLGDAPNIGDMEQLIRKVEKLAKRSKLDRIEKKTVPADEETARDLQIDKGEPVEEISYVRFIDQKPVGYRVSYIPSARNLEITPKDLRSHQMLTILESKGVMISGAHQLIGACLADSQMAGLLNTNVGSPLVRIRLVVLDEDAQPVERSIAYYLAHRYEHHVFLTRNKSSKREMESAL